MKTETVKSGLASLDEVIQGLRYGDNVVWQVDNLEEYKYFAEPFASQAIADGRKCIYLRFAPHMEILQSRPGLTVIELNPEVGFDTFSGEVNKIIESFGREIFYIFDMNCLRIFSRSRAPISLSLKQWHISRSREVSTHTVL